MNALLVMPGVVRASYRSAGAEADLEGGGGGEVEGADSYLHLA